MVTQGGRLNSATYCTPMPTFMRAYTYAHAFWQIAILIVLGKGYVIGWCKSDPERCTKFFHDYKWEVIVQLVNVTATNTSTAAANAHVVKKTVLSTLDVMYSCDFIVIIIALQAYARAPI